MGGKYEQLAPEVSPVVRLSESESSIVVSISVFRVTLEALAARFSAISKGFVL
jgi:hypothetical protein